MIDTLFGSKTRVKLLYLFLNNPGRSFYVREITRRVDEQINSVRRELANMLDIGVIKSDGANNKLYYEADQKYVFYRPLKQIFADKTTPNEIASDVSTTIDWAKRTKKLTNVRAIILSGGFISGGSNKVDILLVGSPPKAQIKRFIGELEEDEHRPLHYTVIPYDDFYYRMSMKDRFISEILHSNHQIILDTHSIIPVNNSQTKETHGN